jgi:thioredoxin-like negative regulator of GroEL
VSLNELAQAETIYSAVLAAKPAGWAALGLARTLFSMERREQAEELLTNLVAANPKLMAAYDLLARCHEAGGAPARAQHVLEDAVAISPHMVRRLRKLGEVALDAGDVAAAEKSFRQVVAKAKYSEFRDPEDHVNLIKALIKKGDPVQAGGVIRDLESPCAATRAWKRAGRYRRRCAISRQRRRRGIRAHDGAARRARHVALSSNLKIGLARSCLSNKLDKEASEVMLSVMNDVGSGVSMQQAMNVFVKAGRPDLAEGMGVQLKAQAQGLLASRPGRHGRLQGAPMQTLLEARHVAPSNLPVMLALVSAILRQIGEQGWDHALGEQCAACSAPSASSTPPASRPLDDQYLAAKRSTAFRRKRRPHCISLPRSVQRNTNEQTGLGPARQRRRGADRLGLHRRFPAGVNQACSKAFPSPPLGRHRRPARGIPSARRQEETPFVDTGRVVTSAGISAGIGMSLPGRARTGRLLAAATARQMEYDWLPSAPAL